VKLAILILAFFMVSTFGCVPMVVEGKKIDSAKLDRVNEGQTRLAEIEGLFGKPDKVEKLPSGEEKYYYFYKRENPHWWTVDRINKQKLEIVIKEGVVQTYKFREEGKGIVLKEQILPRPH
jgi:outer membrane protein assembly factor BamE (lipoprotein component of BamABCDE complex)